MTDIARLGMAVDTEGLKEGQRELQNLVSSGADAERQIDGQTKRKAASWGRMAAKAGLALAAIGTGVSLAVRGQLNDIDRLAKSAQQIGIPVEHLSQLQHAAELSGVSMEELETGLRRLSQNMVQDADKFEALGIAVRDANGEMRPTIDVMDDLADVMAAMPDGAEKTALAMDLMGRSGAGLIPMFNDGADAIRAMREEADQLGLTISEDTAKAAENFNDNITRITGAGRGFWRMISANLAPTLERFSGILVDLVNRFGEMSPRMQSILSNGALMMMVMAPLVAVVGALVGAVALIGAPLLAGAAAFGIISAAVITFWDDIKAAGAAAYEFLDDIGAIEAIGIVFDGIAQQAQNFLDLFRAIFTIDVPAILESLVAIFEQPMQTITALWESEFAAPIRETVTQAIEWVKEQFNALVEWFQELPARLMEIGRDIIAGLWQGIKDGIAEFDPIGAMRELGGNMMRGIGDRIGWNSPATEFIRMGEDIVHGLAIGLNSTGSLAVNAMQNLGNMVTSSAWDMASGVVGAMSQMFQGSKPIAAAQALINTFQGITEALKLAPPGNFIAAARVAAQGFAAVRGIQSARPGSSGGAVSGGGAASGGGATSGGAAAGGGQAQAAAQQAPTTTFQFTIANDPLGFGENFARQFIEQLNEASANGGRVRGVLA